MHGILASLAPETIYPKKQTASENYSDKLGQWRGNDSFRSSIAEMFMQAGGYDATTVVLDLGNAPIIFTPPPFPHDVSVIVVSFNTSNPSRIHDTASGVIDSAFNAKKDNGSDLSIHVNFNGLLTAMLIRNLFANLFGNLPESRQSRLTLHSTETGPFTAMQAQQSTSHSSGTGLFGDMGSALAASSASFATEQASGGPLNFSRSQDYAAEGGLADQIEARKPADPAEAQRIDSETRQLMQQNMKGLKNQTDGLVVKNEKGEVEHRVKLDKDGGDPISGTVLGDGDDVTGWVGIRSGKVVNLYEKATVERLLKEGFTDPITRKKLTINDIIDGQNLVDILKKGKAQAEAEEAAAATEALHTPAPAPASASV